MAINPAAKYPGKTKAPDTDYPYGSAQNVTTPGDGTGTPWEKDLVNDLFGLFQELLSVASVSPSGNPEKVGTSQIADIIRSFHSAPTDNMALGKIIDILTAGKITADNPSGDNLLVELPNAASIDWHAYLSNNGQELWISSNCTKAGSTWTTDAGGPAYALMIELTTIIGVTLFTQYTTGTPWTAWESEALSDLGTSTSAPIKTFKTYAGAVELVTTYQMHLMNIHDASLGTGKHAYANVPFGCKINSAVSGDVTITPTNNILMSATPTIININDYGVQIRTTNTTSIGVGSSAYQFGTLSYKR